MACKMKYAGLTDAEVLKSRDKYGVNILTPAKKTSPWISFLKKFGDPLIVILLIAGILSVGISFYEYIVLGESMQVFFEPVGIFIAIMLATGLAFLFEYKADKEFMILNQVNDDEPVKVIRNSKVVEIARKDVVVGDVVILSCGDEIPADGLLLESVSLDVDESTLTGEPLCHKTVDEAHFNKDATFPSNAVMKGTKVMNGNGVFRVSAVGDATENGKVFTAAQIDNSVKTPLNEQLERLGRLISWLSYSVAALVVVGRIADFMLTEPYTTMTFIAYCLQTVMIAVTLIVVAVPEGLPMAVTLSLAYSMRRMLKTNNLVRKMHACETMGAVTVICTDKTGTLTQNRMTVYEMVCEKLDDVLYENIALNSTANLDGEKVIGNPTEGALLLWMRDAGVDYAEKRTAVEVLDVIPFSTELKYMSTTVRSLAMNGETVTHLKGAPEVVMSMCNMTDKQRAKYAGKLSEFQKKAMRTLAFAYNDVFLGVVAISDPIREDVPAAIRECDEAGIDVKIVTGDTPGTAMEIGRQIGLHCPSDSIITGTDFEALSDEEVYERVNSLKIIARARPMDKKRLVEFLQKHNHVVAVTGDGTNDAPALKAAHVGLSMGNGTSVAKEASDITIIDNSFRSIGRAVMWGRSLYQNIQRFILFQMTVNVVACLIVLVGAFYDTQSPLTVTQMLWVNLIMDTFAAMALASLPPNESVMRSKPRDRSAFIINKSMKWNILSIGLLFTFILLAFYYLFENYDVVSLFALVDTDIALQEQRGLSAYEISLFFTIFVMLQFWNMFNARAIATGHSAFHEISSCRGFVSIVALIFFGQILIVELGGSMFNVVSLSISDWLITVGATSLVLWIGEFVRLVCPAKKVTC
ncbi:MAG: calcium-translocating P-type ATPase, PMCA-type [Prevotella sp.]|nr:calcium-translocating P-type ATPase, PMCA-type [Prevotella sp.]